MPISATNERRTPVRGLGEIALRVNDLDAMQRFYAEVIGLPLMTRVQNCAFFRIADGYGGHTQVLALFDRSGSHGYRGLDAALSTIDHIALEIPLADFADGTEEAGVDGASSRNRRTLMGALALALCERPRRQSSGTGLLRRQCVNRDGVFGWHLRGGSAPEEERRGTIKTGGCHWLQPRA
jgi:catechol 2,3-dioxygenase-like lactoylglutathione lyase family enzyme